MSVAAATGAVSTQLHQPTQEQIRLAQLIEDKKHDQPEVQEIVRKVLDVVANSNQEDALLALFDCDYDYERAVALLIEKGHDIASEWRTATNHKINKRQQQQQQQKTAASTKNGHEGFSGESYENGQHRGNDGFTYRSKSRGGRSRFQQQHNGGDSQNNQQQQNDNYMPQQRPRGTGSGHRGRYRVNNRGGHREIDRNYQQQHQDSNVDNSPSSDTTQHLTDVSHTDRRGGGGGGRRQPEQQWDVGNWNGETLIYSRTTKEDEQPADADTNSAHKLSPSRTGVPNGQSLSLGAVSSTNNTSELNAQQMSQPEFDPEEAARQIKNVIGIGQSQQHSVLPKPLMDLKPLMNDQSNGQQIKSKSFGQTLNTKVTSPSGPRIPHQPVVFTDRFDGGLSKIDVQFGNLGEPFEEPTSSHNVSVPASTAFYQNSNPITSVTKQNNASSSMSNALRSTTLTHQQSREQSPFISPTAPTSSTRPSEQLPVMNQQRMLPPQLQQQQQQQQQVAMAMKPVVPPPYGVHQQQPQVNPQNMVLHSLFYHHQQQQQQQEPVALDNSYDPGAFQLPSADFNAPYFMATPMNPAASQQQARYLVSQPGPPPAQVGTSRQPSSTNVQTSSVPTSSVTTSSTSTSSSTATKKAPVVPPGIFLPPTVPPTQPAYSAAYSTPYGIPLSVSGQQQTAAVPYSALYDAEHSFANSYIQFANAQQAQSPSGAYGSVTPPVHQQNQQQQAHNNNDNKAMNFRGPMTENLLLLQQYSIQQSNNQQQGQQGVAHSPAQLNYYLGHPASGHSYPSGPQIMYAAAGTPMNQQQQGAKQQGQHYNQSNPSSGMGGNEEYYGRGASSSSNKEGQYMYAVTPGQPQQAPTQSVGQQQGTNKQQSRSNNNVYNNQQNQQRSFQ